jgi:hypothetical protein
MTDCVCVWRSAGHGPVIAERAMAAAVLQSLQEAHRAQIVPIVAVRRCRRNWFRSGGRYRGESKTSSYKG